MKVLLVNSYYRLAAGGAETVVLATQAQLERAGHEVVPFAIDEADTLPTPWRRYFPTGGSTPRGLVPGPSAFASVYSFESRRALRRLLRDWRPDVAHLHNIAHRLTLSVLDALTEARVPIVFTLHDYQWACPNARMYTHDGVCTRCLGGGFWQALHNRCQHGRALASALVALDAYLARARHQLDKVDLFLSPSRFLASVMAEAGLPADRIEVLPNAVEAEPVPRSSVGRPPRIVYFGRFSPEKGLDVLAEAARFLDPGVRVVLFGSGELEDEVRRRATGLPVDVRGYAQRDVIFDELSTAAAAVLPSSWHENCSMAILEAAGLGVPSITTTRGGNPELVTHCEDGLLVPPGDPLALARAMNQLAREPVLALRLGHAAWRRAREHHDPERHVAALVEHYRQVVPGAPGSPCSGQPVEGVRQADADLEVVDVPAEPVRVPLRGGGGP